MTVRERILKLGCELPKPAEPVGSYVPAARTGNVVLTAGQIPIRGGKLLAVGKVPHEVTVEEARAAARQCVLNALSAVEGQIGHLDRIVRIIRINVYVNSSPDFTDQARVADAASDLLVEIFEDAGRHTRCAIGVASLPLGAPVELDVLAEIN